MRVKEYVIFIENHGISIIFLAILVYFIFAYGRPFMDELIRTQRETRIFMQNFNRGALRGRSLETLLVLKAKDIRNTIECETKDRIETNHLKENWSVIPIEITTFFNIRLTNFEYEVHAIIDETLYNVVFNLFKNRIFECRDIIMQLLESLKDDGEEEPELYEVAVRQLEAYMKKFETDLINDVKELLG